jgi:hypothetical protein
MHCIENFYITLEDSKLEKRNNNIQNARQKRFHYATYKQGTITRGGESSFDSLNITIKIFPQWFEFVFL